jgi:hypothetical protein
LVLNFPIFDFHFLPYFLILPVFFIFLQKKFYKQIFFHLFLRLSVIFLLNIQTKIFGEEMKDTGKNRNCPFCHISFTPEKHNTHSQVFCCRNSECKQASSRAASKKYREKKRSDMNWKRDESERVKNYQREHPNYWKREKKDKNFSPDLLLRDFVQARKTADFPVLRDFVLYIGNCLIGFIGHTSDWDNDLLLRDSIGSLLNGFYDKGIALSSKRNINPQKKENYYHDSQGTCKSTSPETNG